MKVQLIRYKNVITGLIFYAIGVALMIKVHLGLAPWDVFNQGLSKTYGITIGTANFIVGAAVLLVAATLKQHIGIATLFDLFLVGLFIDLFNILFIDMEGFTMVIRILLFIVGLFFCGYGCFLYIPQGIGCGPRDGLLLGFSRKLGLPVGIIGITMEGFALLCGYLLGGKVGLGTIFVTFLKGPILQAFFKLNDVDAHSIKHRHLLQEYKILKRYLKYTVRGKAKKV